MTNGRGEAGPATRTWDVEVVVMPKEGVNDPAGDAILGGLHDLGYAAIERVRAGRVFRLAVGAITADAARSEVVATCEQLLANPVIEAYRITRLEPAKGEEAGAK